MGNPNENVRIPKWLWGVLTGVVCASFPLSYEIFTLEAQASQNARSLHQMATELADVRQVVATTREEQLRRTNPVYGVGDLKAELSQLRKMLEEVRDDVIVLKTQRQ